jgi:hypothetical protein
MCPIVLLSCTVLRITIELGVEEAEGKKEEEFISVSSCNSGMDVRSIRRWFHRLARCDWLNRLDYPKGKCWIQRKGEPIRTPSSVYKMPQSPR